MSIPFEMLGAPGALIPSLTNLVAAYANKARSDRERERDDKHRDFAQRLQLRGMELQEQKLAHMQEAAELDRQRRQAEHDAMMKLKRAEDTRRQAAHEAGLEDRERGIRTEQYLHMEQPEGSDPSQRLQLGADLGFVPQALLEQYLAQREAASGTLGRVGGMNYGDAFTMGVEGAESLAQEALAARQQHPYLVDDPKSLEAQLAMLARVREHHAQVERYQRSQQAEAEEASKAPERVPNLPAPVGASRPVRSRGTFLTW